MTKRIGASTYFTMVIGIVMVVLGIDAITTMPFMAAVYPACVAGAVFMLTAVQVIHDFRRGQSVVGALDIERADTTLSVRYQKGGRVFLWVVGLYLATFVLGFKLGAVAFLFGYLVVEDKGGWLKIGLSCAGVYLLLDVFQRFFGVWWPAGLVGEFLEQSTYGLF